MVLYMGVRILVVDDEEDLCEILQFNLEGEGFEVDVAYSAEEALTLDLKRYQIILLDVMMGKISGFRLARTIRQEMKLATPFLFITAREGEENTLTGFSLGADDYIVKPFAVKEVVARVKAVLQRSGINARPEQEVLSAGGVEIDVGRKMVFAGENNIMLSKKEFEILHLLMTNGERIFSREEILDRVWSYDVVVNERTVDVHITRLRKKLGEYGKLIRSRPGYGYYFDIR